MDFMHTTVSITRLGYCLIVWGIVTKKSNSSEISWVEKTVTFPESTPMKQLRKTCTSPVSILYIPNKI